MIVIYSRLGHWWHNKPRQVSVIVAYIVSHNATLHCALESVEQSEPETLVFGLCHTLQPGHFSSDLLNVSPECFLCPVLRSLKHDPGH